MGYTDYDMQRPIIGVCNPWSELNPGHWHFRTLADAVKRGIWAAGGFPLEFPTISMCEVFHNISTLIYRNLMALDTEEFMDSMPFDGVVLLSTCDKDVPGAAHGHGHGQQAVASSSPAARAWPASTRGRRWPAPPTRSASTWNYKAGVIGEAELNEVEMNGFFNTCGACGVMGTANSVQSMAEALGMTLPGSASIPAVYAQRIAHRRGHRHQDHGAGREGHQAARHHDPGRPLRTPSRC